MRRTSITALIVAVVLVGSACNSRLIRPPTKVYIDSGDRTISTRIDQTRYDFPAAFTGFFPSSLALHPRDAINFELRDTGEPHTVALGKVVNSAAKAIEELGTTATLRKIEALPQMRRVPSVLPATVEEGAEVNRSATERCFLDDGVPPVSATGGAQACPERKQPAFDGTQSFYSSGFIPSGESFRVPLAGDIKPSTYTFMCLVHRSAMTGTIEVRPADVPRPRVSEVGKAASDDLNEAAANLEPPVRSAVSRTSGPVLAGAGAIGRARGFVTGFIPKVKETRVGETVQWRFFQTHSISFKPSRDAKEGILLEEGSGATINAEAWKPVESKPPPSDALVYPPTGKKITIDGGTYSGEGAFSSGIIRAIPPTVVNYTLTLAKAGSYTYECLVHPSMLGKLEVSE